MKYEEHEMNIIRFDEKDVFASWVTESGEDGYVQSINPYTTDK